MSAQKIIVLMCSGSIPRDGASLVRSTAPSRNPMAIPRPCGEIANVSPMRMRSRTGQPIEAIVSASTGGV